MVASKGSPSLASPPRWDDERLDSDRTKAIEAFREDRLTEPLEAYLDVFESYRDAFDDLLETTVDLTLLAQNAVEVLTDARFLEAVRYLAAPPMSTDDLVTLAEAPSLAPKVIKADPELAQRIIATVLDGLDRRRFPWFTEEREATEQERASAVLASTALLATQRVNTDRKNKAKTAQEELVAESLAKAKFKKVIARDVHALSAAPKPGEFCSESKLGDRKADLVVGLWDGRVMPIECKVSNSATNSIKRLNNDAVVKAALWRKGFGDTQVVPVAVLSGVFKLLNLCQAQEAGIALFWAHDLGEMTDWIKTTKVK